MNEEIKIFQQKIEIIKFIIKNMKEIMADNILLLQITEEPNRHPHYMSNVTTSLMFDDEEECLVYRESRSGSPGAVNHYDTPVDSIIELSRWIAEDINAANNILSSKEDEDVKGWTIDIEGV